MWNVNVSTCVIWVRSDSRFCACPVFFHSPVAAEYLSIFRCPRLDPLAPFPVPCSVEATLEGTAPARSQHPARCEDTSPPLSASHWAPRDGRSTALTSRLRAARTLPGTTAVNGGFWGDLVVRLRQRNVPTAVNFEGVSDKVWIAGNKTETLRLLEVRGWWVMFTVAEISRQCLFCKNDLIRDYEKPNVSDRINYWLEIIIHMLL